MIKTILMKSIKLISLIITLTFTLAPALYASIDSAEKIIEKVIEKYSEFQSYSSSVEITKTISSYGAENKFKASYDVDISRPNKFSLRHTGGIFGKTMVSNGEQMWIYISHLDKYTRLSPPAKMEDILKPGRESLSDFASEQFLIFSFSESNDKLSDIFNGAEINLIDKKENYYLISFKTKNMEMKLHINKKDFSIYKVQANMSPVLNMHNNHSLSYPDDLKIYYTEIHENIVFDQSLNTSLFTFTPPENAEKADDIFFQDRQAAVPYKGKNISEKEFIEPESGREFTLSDFQGRFIILCFINPKEKLTRDFIDDLENYMGQKEKTQIILVARKEKELIELLKESNSSFKGALDSEPYINESFSFERLPAVITVGPKGEIKQVYSGYFEGLSQMIMEESHLSSLNHPGALAGNTLRLKGLDIKWNIPLNVTQIISDKSIYAISPSGRLYTISLSGSVIDLIHIGENYNRFHLHQNHPTGPAEFLLYREKGTSVEIINEKGVHISSFTVNPALNILSTAELNSEDGYKIILGMSGKKGIAAVSKTGSIIFTSTEASNIISLDTIKKENQETSILAVSSEGSLYIFSLEGVLKRELPLNIISGFVKSIDSSTILLSGSAKENEILKLIDLQGKIKWETILGSAFNSRIISASMHPHGVLFACGTRNGQLMVFDVEGNIKANAYLPGMDINVQWASYEDFHADLISSSSETGIHSYILTGETD